MAVELLQPRNMKSIKIKAAVFTSAVLLLGGSTIIKAAEKPQDTLFYKVTGEGEAVITGCAPRTEELSIPSTIEGLPVVGIGERAFSGRTDIRRLLVGEGIRYIATGSFAGCVNLEEIELEEGLQYIGSEAFCGDAAIGEISLPQSVLYVGEKAFGDCLGLAALDFPANACVDAYAFEGSAWQEGRDEGRLRIRGSCLESWDDSLPELNIPYGITKIADHQWMGRATEQTPYMESIILPDTLVEMGRNCFNNVSTRSLYIPPGIRKIKDYAFEWFHADEIKLSEGLRTLGECAFSDSDLKGIELPDTLETIEYGAFMSCQELERITIPGSVRYIGNGAFYQCDALREVVFEEGLEVVHADAFSHCGLERLQFPESLRSIEEGEYGTFSSALRRVYIPKGTVNIDEALFRYFVEYDSPIVVYGQKGSRAEAVALAAGMEFVEVESGDEMP